MSSEELEYSGGTEEFIQSITTDIEHHKIDLNSDHLNMEAKGPLLYSSPYNSYVQQQKKTKHIKPDVSLIMNQEPPPHMDNTISSVGSSLFESESHKNQVLAGKNLPTPQKCTLKLNTIDNFDELNYDSDFEDDINKIFTNLGQHIESLTESDTDDDDKLFYAKVNDTILKPKQSTIEPMTRNTERNITPPNYLKSVPEHYLPKTSNSKKNYKSVTLVNPKNYFAGSNNNKGTILLADFPILPTKLGENYVGIPPLPNQTLNLAEPLKSTIGPEISRTKNVANNLIFKNNTTLETLKSHSACELNIFVDENDNLPINDTLQPTVRNLADLYWSEKEHRKLENKLFRQSTQYKTEIEQLTRRINDANEKLEIARTENQTISKNLKTEIATLNKKIRDLQSEKVQLINKMKERDEQKSLKQSNEIQKVTSIAEHYKTKTDFLKKRLETHDEIINGKSQEIAKLEVLLAESNQKALEVSNEIKQQAKNFVYEQKRLENELQESKFKSQKQFQRDKVLSIQKFQEDFSKTQKEEIQNLKQTLSEEKQKTITRLEETYNQKYQKLEENVKKLEGDCSTANETIKNKNDMLKNMELNHKSEVS